MADGNTATVFSGSSIWLWLFRPLSIAITSLGLVMFVAGITSYIVYGPTTGSRILLTPFGGFILSFGVLLGIGVVCRMREEKRMRRESLRRNNDIIDLTSEFTTADISMETASHAEARAQEMRRYSQESVHTIPPLYEDVLGARSIPPLLIDVTCLVDSDEVLLSLENSDEFESPPSYEEAISGG